MTASVLRFKRASFLQILSDMDNNSHYIIKHDYPQSKMLGLEGGKMVRYIKGLDFM